MSNKKIKPVKSKISLIVIIFFVVCIIAIAGVYFVKSSMQKPSVNLIGGTEYGVSMPSNELTTSPSGSLKTCATVKAFSVSGNCGNNNYLSMTFTCGGSVTVRKQGGTGVCKPYTTWYGYAQSLCASSCAKATIPPSYKRLTR